MVLAGRKKLKLDVDFLADNFEAAGSTIFRSAFLSRLGISLHFIHHYTTLHYTPLHTHTHIPAHTPHGRRSITMESRGLTLRSKSRRPRPQISAPKPISGPAPANNSRTPDSGQGNATPSAASRERAPQSDATSDLVKRRYSTRFNQVPDLDANAPPVPGLPPGAAAKYGGLGPPPTTKRPSTGQAGPPEVDLNALRDPSLPVDRCEWPPQWRFLKSYVNVVSARC